jgi:hypothetical protein
MMDGWTLYLQFLHTGMTLSQEMSLEGPLLWPGIAGIRR